MKSVQERRIPQTSGVPLLKPIVVNEPLGKVSMDFVGSLPRTKNENQWIFVLSGYFTCCPDAYALPSSNAELVAQKLVEYISIYGFPKELLTDHGANFRSFQELRSPISDRSLEFCYNF